MVAEASKADVLDREAIWKDFNRAVNMSLTDLEDWLDTEASRAVGERKGSQESVGHQSGRRVVAIRRKKRASMTDDDYRHMRDVVAFVNRHLAQGGPKEDRQHSPWRYSLMNWGHDPLKRRS